MIKLSDYVMNFIASEGVKHVFMLSGGGAMHLNDSIGKSKELKYICTLHEQAAAIAAEAYSQYTNNLGVALVTTGPGGTNTLTGVAGAWLDSIPCLFVSGQVKRADLKTGLGIRQMGFQEIDIVKMVESITKYAYTVTEPETIKYHLEKAMYLAREGRPGPVWIDIPLDVQSAMIDEKNLEGFNKNEISNIKSNTDLSEKVNRTIQYFNKSERPIILVGNGVRLAKAYDKFVELIDYLKIPILTTWKTIDFLAEDHPFFVGRPGASGQRGANFSQQNSDWLLSIGARLDMGQTAFSHKNFAREAKKIIVDIDENEIKKFKMPIEIKASCDALDFISELLKQKHKIQSKDRSNWLKQCKSWQEKYPVVLKEYWDEKGYVNNYVLIDVLSDLMTENDLLVPGSSGACSELTMQTFRLKKGQRVFNTEGLGSMGYGISATIGGTIASGRRTVSIEGDGGFIMNVQELETVKRLNLPIKFFVLNNNGYGSIRNTQKNYFNSNFVGCDKDSGVTLPSFKKIAAAFGIDYFQLKDHNGIKNIVKEILNSNRPTLCEVMISENQILAPRVMSYRKEDGSMASKPMEDMYPFLKREEFLKNMLIKPIEV